MMQSTQRLRFHVRESENTSAPHPVRFHLSPDTFIRVQLRTVPGQQVQTQLSLITPNGFRNLAGFVDGMSVPNQKNRLRAPNHQAVQKSADNFRIQSALFNHKPHSTPPIHRADHVQSKPRPRTMHHRGLSLTPPSRPRMIIASQTRFISKPDFPSQSFGLFGNRRIFLLDPLPHALGILLIRPPQGLLRSDSQLRQQTPYRIDAQTNIIPSINQCRDRITCPQGEWKLILSRITPNHYPINPFDHTPIQLAGTGSSFACVQAIPSTGAIHRQPVVDASTAKPHGAHDNLWTFTALHARHRSFPKFRQYFMLQFPAIHHFLFHDRYYISMVRECLYYYGLISNSIIDQRIPLRDKRY